MIVVFPDGTSVQACGLGQDDGLRPDHGLYLDQRWNPDWPHEHIPWDDFGIPDDPDAAMRTIESVFDRARHGERIQVGCLGGLGRTGTVLACMAVLSGVPGDRAVEWVRANYRPRAVETPEQERFVETFAARRTRKEDG